MTKRLIAVEPRRYWTSDEDAILRARFPHEPTAVIAAVLGRRVGATAQRANKMGIHKSAEFLKGPLAGRIHGGFTPGAKRNQYPKGHVPANKGLRRPGWAPGRMAATQFKKGSLSGTAKERLQPVGAERVSKDGYLERKTHHDLPPDLTRQERARLMQRRWRAVHILVWEEANGPLPMGFAVCFKDGNKRNIRLDNLELIARADLMQRNTIHNLPPELKDTVRLLGRVNRQIRKRERHAEEQDHRPS